MRSPDANRSSRGISLRQTRATCSSTFFRFIPGVAAVANSESIVAATRFATLSGPSRRIPSRHIRPRSRTDRLLEQNRPGDVLPSVAAPPSACRSGISFTPTPKPHLCSSHEIHWNMNHVANALTGSSSHATEPGKVPGARQPGICDSSIATILPNRVRVPHGSCRRFLSRPTGEPEFSRSHGFHSPFELPLYHLHRGRRRRGVAPLCPIEPLHGSSL